MSKVNDIIKDIDICENELLHIKGILTTLLMDRTTGSNIIWATNDYAHLGEQYSFNNTIEVELITGDNSSLIQPRIKKCDAQQRNRSRNMAEVFTPAWVCNKQNNLVDKAWFGCDNVFNTENEDHSWTSHKIPKFPKGKTLNNYISDNRIEITCGEAPYLVSRYDATTGKIIEIGSRVGLLDRKLWAINMLTPDDNDSLLAPQRKRLKREWLRKAYKAYQSTYGFEWQGDNLLLAREALFVSFIEYYQAKWNTKKFPELPALQKVAEIISWNIWQMDGLTYGIPGHKTLEDEGEIFVDEIEPCSRLCRVMKWTGSEPLKGNELKFKDLLSKK